MKTLEEIKEEALKKIAKTIRYWFKLEIGFAQAHKEIGEVLESTISQTKQELIEKVRKEFENKANFESGVHSYGWYTIYKNEFEELLEDLNKK